MECIGDDERGTYVALQPTAAQPQQQDIPPVSILGKRIPPSLFMLENKNWNKLLTRHPQYGMYQIMHDDTFLTWPPSPQLAMTLFPYVRSVYYNMWREFVLPYEIKLNRQILGLPPVDPNNEGQQGGNQRRQAQRNGDGGFIGLLQGILDALDPDDEDDDLQVNGMDHFEIMHGDGDDNGNAGGDAELMIELRIEEVEDVGDGQNPIPGRNEVHIELDDNAAAAQQAEQADEPANRAPDGAGPAAAPAENGAPVNAGENDDANGQNQAQHEVPPAPPARRMGLGALLSSISNAVVSALILPGVSFAMGEALRFVLPKAWTSSASRNPWSLYAGIGGRPGLLQQQWGRSLVGGCLYVVLKDVVRVYAKSRRVATMGNRRVKNVDRKRGNR